MTANANPLGILIGWAIVAVGMFALTSVYRNLTLQQPEIDDGIYGWSKALLVTSAASLPITATESATQSVTPRT